MKDRLNGMRVFAQVVEAKSFSAAADKLGMSTSLASRHVSALERGLSVKLLNRTTRKLSLTEAGALFYEHCARIVQEAELAEQRLTRTQSEPAGLVKVTAVPAFATRHVLPALAEFHQKYPAIAPKGVWTLKRGRHKYSVQVAGVLETDEMDMVHAAVIAGLGISFLPVYMAGDALRQGQLVPLLRQFQLVPESAIYLVYLPNRTLSSRVRALIDFLADRFGPTPSWEEGW